MGEQAKTTSFRPGFNPAAQIQTSTTSITSEVATLLLREIAENLDLPSLADDLVDDRNQDQVTYPLRELFLTRILLIAQGWRDQDDVTALRQDPALCLAVSSRKGTSPLDPPKAPLSPAHLPSQPTLSRFQSMLASQHNRHQLAAGMLQRAVARIRSERGFQDERVIDVDSTPYEAHGEQEGAVWNGCYEVVGFHPLLAYADVGDLLGIMLRPGNVHTAAEIRTFLRPILSTVQPLCKRLWLRIDAGYAGGAIQAWLTEKRVRFITRLPNNDALERQLAGWHTRMAATWAADPRPEAAPREALREFWYRSKGWTRLVRVVAVVVEVKDPKADKPNWRVFYIASNASRAEASSYALLTRYRQRGGAEQLIGEFKRTLAATVSSVPRPKEGHVPPGRPVGMGENEVSLLLAGVAYNLLHALRCALEGPLKVRITLQRLREEVLGATALVVRHARRVVYRISEAYSGMWEVVCGVIPGIRSVKEGSIA